MFDVSLEEGVFDMDRGLVEECGWNVAAFKCGGICEDVASDVRELERLGKGKFLLNSNSRDYLPLPYLSHSSRLPLSSLPSYRRGSVQEVDAYT